MTPEMAARLAAQNESQIWDPIVNANRNSAMANRASAAVQQTARNYEVFYENEIAKIEQNHALEIERLKKIARDLLAEKDAAIQKAQVSSYLYNIEYDALLIAIENIFGKDALDGIVGNAVTVSQKIQDDDAKESYPLFENHQLLELTNL
jgi:hypothetical protein